MGWNWRSERSGYADALSPSQLHLRINQCKFTPKFAKYSTSIYCVVFCNVISYLNCRRYAECSIISLTTHSLLTHSLTPHSLTHSLTHSHASLTHSLTHSLELTHTHSLTHSLARSHSLTHAVEPKREDMLTSTNFPERLKLFAPLFSPSFHLLL